MVYDESSLMTATAWLCRVLEVKVCLQAQLQPLILFNPLSNGVKVRLSFQFQSHAFSIRPQMESRFAYSPSYSLMLFQFALK